LNNNDYFNSNAETWDSQVIHNMSKVKKIIDLVGICKGDRVLDVGTGTGVTIPVLQSYVGDHGKIVAIDAAEKMIEVARRKFNDPNVEFVIGDVLETTFKDAKFDSILCYSMFPHFDDKPVAIATLARLLKKNGKLVICHSQSRDAINHMHASLPSSVQKDVLPPMAEIRQIFKDSGMYVALEIDDDEMFVIMGALR